MLTTLNRLPVTRSWNFGSTWANGDLCWTGTFITESPDKSHGFSWTLLCKVFCITHSPFLHMSHSRHSVWPQTFHSSCPRLFPDLVVQRLLHVSHSVWTYTNNLPFFTFQPYSWTLLCKGSCISHVLSDIPFTLPNSQPRREVTQSKMAANI